MSKLWLFAFFLSNLLLNYVCSQKCGYDSCVDTEALLAERNDTIVVHLLAHTHDDVGWLKTVDQYYYGTKPYIQQASVRLILDSVIAALAVNPERKFTYVEMEFFSKWWSLQSNTTRALVHRLVNNGQLHFVLAGISMSDEAAVNYDDSINQLTWGANYLKNLFGDCGKPNVAWQIDPFGHSRDQARIFRDAGFDGVFFQRMDYREKQVRRDKKQLEHLWLVDPDADVNVPGYNSKAFFTGVLRDSYCYPATFCFDELCQDEQIVDDPGSSENNVQGRVSMFLRYVESISANFATRNIIVPMGCDFTYQNAHQNFQNTDLLIKYANRLYERGLSKFKLVYSTPDCYTLALNKAFHEKGSIPVKPGDFFPYASEGDRYWTGFFTSRPAFKYSVRKASNELRLCEQEHFRESAKLVDRIERLKTYLGTETDESRRIQLLRQIETTQGMLKGNTKIVDTLRKTMGLSLHHDAITGTAKQQVAYDYSKLLHEAVTGCQNYIGSSMEATFCNTLNVSECAQLAPDATFLEGHRSYGRYEYSSKITVDIIVSNPLAWPLTNSWVKIPIYLASLQEAGNINLVNNATGQKVAWQVLPIDFSLIRIPERKFLDPKANYHLIFNTMDTVPGMASLRFTLSISADSLSASASRINLDTHDQVAWEENGEIRQTGPVSFSRRKIVPQTESRDGGDHQGRVMSFVFANDPEQSLYHLHADIQFYKGNTNYGQSTGAYVFTPVGSSKPISSLRNGTAPQVKVRTGPLVQETYVNYSDWAQLTVRLYSDQQLEVDWTVGPIPDDMGYESREVIVRYWVEKEGDLRLPKEDQEFFVDSNGRRLIRRENGRRIYWNLPVPDSDLEEWRIEGNYYPVNSRAIVKGLWGSMALAVYTDRAQGVAMLKPGQLEFMVNRRCMQDDGFGVGEPLKENGVDGKALVVRGTHVIRFDSEQVIEEDDRETSALVANPTILMFQRRFDQSQAVPSNNRRQRYRNRRRRNLPQVKLGLLNALNPVPSYMNVIGLSKWPLENDEDTRSLEKKQLLLRLEVFNVTQAAPCIMFELNNLLTNIRITRAVEMTITANQEMAIATKNRMTWPGEAPEWMGPGNGCYSYYWLEKSASMVALVKGEIHTFICDYE